MDSLNLPHQLSEQSDIAVSSLIPFVAKAHRKLANSLLHDLGLAAGQELILMLLWEKSPQPQAELTRQVMVEPPTMAKALARLENLELVSRQRSEEDRRVMLVSLTAAGHALEEPVSSVWATLEAFTTSGLSESEQDLLRTLLTKVSDTLATVSNLERDDSWN